MIQISPCALKIIPWLKPCVEFQDGGAEIVSFCARVCLCVCLRVLWWVVERSGRQQRVVWIKPEWKNSLSFLWALIITPREFLLHCVYLLSQLSLCTNFHSQTYTLTGLDTNPVVSATLTNMVLLLRTYKYGYKHVIITSCCPVQLAVSHSTQSGKQEESRWRWFSNNGQVVSVRMCCTWVCRQAKRETVN